MDLHSAVKRYDEGRQFWAREIALLLKRRRYRNWRVLLRHLAASGQPMLATTLGDALPSQRETKLSRETLAARVLKDLANSGLVKRTRTWRTHWHALSELGELVLTYLPFDPEVDVWEKVPVTLCDD